MATKTQPIQAGQKFGKWTVITPHFRKRRHAWRALVQCVCGYRTTVRETDLRVGKTSQCVECCKKAMTGHRQERSRQWYAGINPPRPDNWLADLCDPDENPDELDRLDV